MHPKDEDISKIATVDGTVYTTSLFELPAGGVGFAFGGQFRRETLKETPDPLNVAGDIVGNSRSRPPRGKKSYSLYAETIIPIFSPNNAIRGFYSLEFTAGARFEEFLNNNTNVLVPKVGMRWQPFGQELTLRSTWGEGYRQPSLEELFSAPISTLFGSSRSNEWWVLRAGNEYSYPEQSESATGGFSILQCRLRLHAEGCPWLNRVG